MRGSRAGGLINTRGEDPWSDCGSDRGLFDRVFELAGTRRVSDGEQNIHLVDQRVDSHVR